MNVESVAVVPCYKEAKRIKPEQYIHELKNFSSVVVLVDDGSPDNTFDILKKLEYQVPDRFVAVKLSKNSGKAEAIRYGINYAINNYENLKYIGYLDADLAVKFSEIPPMLDCFSKNPEINTVIGVRSRLAGHKIERSLPAYLLQRVIAKMGSFLIKKDIIDSQCGAKFFDANILKKVTDKPFISKWLFDQELLTRISRLPENADKNWLFEYPVLSWTEIGGTHRKTSDYFKCLIEYFKILKKYCKKV